MELMLQMTGRLRDCFNQRRKTLRNSIKPVFAQNDAQGNQNKQEPKDQYQKDALKVLTQLNEEKYQGLYAVIESAEFLEDTAKCRILGRIVDFAQNDEKATLLLLELATDESNSEHGLTTFFPAMLGAVPWVASKIACPVR